MTKRSAAAGRPNRGRAVKKAAAKSLVKYSAKNPAKIPAVPPGSGIQNIGASPPMKVTRSVLLKELSAWSINRTWLQGLIPYNPDDLVGRHGLVIYRDMVKRDGVVKNALETKILARLSTGYTIMPPDKEVEPRAAELAEFVEYNIEQLRGNFLEALRKIMSALQYGFSITEENWKIYKRGKWSGLLGIDTLKTKDPRDWDFKVDPFGNLEYLIQGLTTGQRNALPPEKFIIFSYMGEHGNWYGTSDLRAAYRDYFSKDMVGRFWNIALEKFGMPTVYAKIPDMEDQGEAAPDGAEQAGGLSQDDRDYLLDLLDKIQSATSFYIPQGVDLALLESKKASGKAGYEMAMNYFDKGINKAVLLPTLITDEGQRGTQALGREHSKTFLYVLNYLGGLVEEIINEQMVRRVVDYNFRDVEAYPFFKFKEYGYDKEKAYGELLELAATIGALPDPAAPWVRDKFGFPALVDGKIPGEPKPADDTKPEPGPEDKEEKDEGEGEGISQGDTTPTIRDYMLQHVVPFMEAKHSPKSDWPKHESLGTYVALLEDFQDGKGKATALTPATTDLKVRKLPRKKTPAEQKVDYKEIQTWWEALSDKTVEKLETSMRGVKKSVTKQARKIAESGNPSDIDKLQLPVKDMSAFRKAMEELYTLDYVKGIQDAANEVGKGLGKSLAGFEDGPYGLHFHIDLDMERVTFAAPTLDPTEAIEYLTRKRPVLRRNLRAYLRRAFTVTGVEKERVLAEVKSVLETGIARGSTVPGMMGEVDEVFMKYVPTGEIVVDPDTGKSVLRTPHRLETIVRTNLSEAYNSGRMALYSDPEVVDVVDALQYSAVIDSRTTEFCRRYDGFTRPPTDPAWNEIVPPNHFNCRSIVVPVVTGEDWVRTVRRPGIEPQEGFKL